MSNPVPPEPPINLADWLWYVRYHEQAIFVREKNNVGKWETVALAKLPLQKQSRHIARWLSEGKLPVRLIEEKV